MRRSERGPVFKKEKDVALNPFIAAASLLVVLYYSFPFIFGSCIQLIITTLAQYQSILFHVSLLLGTFAYFVYVRKSAKSATYALGLNKKKLTLKNIGIGIGAYFIMLGILLLGALMYLLYLYASGGISSVLSMTHHLSPFLDTPLWFRIMAFTLVPVSEEVFNRGFLTQKIGIFWSSVIFAALHASYCSYIELAGTLLFGLIAGYLFKRTGSLYPSITTHVLYNFVGLILAR